MIKIIRKVITGTENLIRFIHENEMKEVKVTLLDYLVFGERNYLVVQNLKP